MSERVGSDKNGSKFKRRISNRFWVNLEIQFESRSMSDPTLSDNYFENEMDLDYAYFFFQKAPVINKL